MSTGPSRGSPTGKATPTDPALLRYELELARWQLEKERGRRASRMAATIAAARGRPRGWLRLPFDLWRESRSPGPPLPRRPSPPDPPERAGRTDATPARKQRQRYVAPSLTARTWPEGPIARPELRIAAILDEFSERAFAYEATLTQLHPDRWQEQLAAADPALLFVESAWRGHRDSWRHHLTTTGEASPQLQALVEACRRRGIPTVFWNKEDPPNYERFIAAAALFDHVLTVDAGTVARYRKDLGHERIGVLPFAAQPRIHHPVLTPEGRDLGVVFAGTYHVDKHPHRKVQVMQVIDPARAFDLHIYARFTARAYRWPSPLDEHVVGSLSYAQTLEAYRRYRVVLNVNSVPRSDTMCARRIFELLACGSTVLSGVSPAIEHLLGEGLVPQSDDPDLTARLLNELLEDDARRARLAALGLRRVLSAHTYEHRLREVLEVAGVDDPLPDRVGVRAVVPVTDEVSDRFWDEIAAQQTAPDQVVFVGAEAEVSRAGNAAARAGLPVVTAPSTAPAAPAAMRAAREVASQAVAMLDPATRYGPAFLTDQRQALAYSSAGAVIKAAHHVTDGRRVTTTDEHLEHRHTTRAVPGSVLFRGGVLDRLPDVADVEDALEQLGPQEVVATSRYQVLQVVDRLPDGTDVTTEPPEQLAYA
ncbi:glycosyltransferase [Nitriliruptoraceae bacterium ZYF776]|nr:glycosyltransferase [Profundirhabdus halotolerans]